MDYNLLMFLVAALSIIIAIGTSFYAIYMSWKFSIQTNNTVENVSRRIDDTLKKILESSKVTESTTTQTIPQILGLLERQWKQSVDQRAREVFPTLSMSEEDKKTLLETFIGSLQSEISKTLTPLAGGLAFTGGTLRIIEKSQEFVLPERFQNFDWYKLFTTLDHQERNNKFVAAGHFRVKVLAGRLEDIEAFQFAIDNNIILKYSLPNPKNPLYPTTAIKLNRSHPLVIKYLGVKET